MDLASKRVVVMGLGRFGGGAGVTRYLVRQGADVLVTDTDPADKLRESLAALEGLPVDYRLGEHNVSDFTTADLIVANPAVKPDNRFLRAAEAADIPMTTEIRLLVERLPNRKRVIGVTGTAGKSTVAAMIAHVLKKAGEQESRRAGKVWLGGNIGGSLLDSLDDIGDDDWVVLELSSFMLHHLREGKHVRGWSPGIAVVTNFAPNHLDWHGTAEAYQCAKQAILDYQEAERDAAVFGPGIHNRFDHAVRNMMSREAEDVRQNPPIALPLPGHHNQVNATLACDAATLAGIDFIDAVQALSDFPGLPHRLQFVGEFDGVKVYNDSKSTTPEAAILAIESFDTGTVHAILGGADKGADLKPLAGFSAQRCAGIYAIGQTGAGIFTAAEAAAPNGVVVDCQTLDRAVTEALTRAKPGHILLLSPGCASWDQFTNYEQRGERFIELVQQEKKPTA